MLDSSLSNGRLISKKQKRALAQGIRGGGKYTLLRWQKLKGLKNHQ